MVDLYSDESKKTDFFSSSSSIFPSPKFLSKIKAKVFVRGHDYNLLGYSIYGDKCLTILSSRLYKEMGNGGILVAIAENKVNKASYLSVSDFSSGNWSRYKIFKK